MFKKIISITSFEKFVWIAWAIGAILRLLWIQDMEYKFDEEYMFLRTQNVGVSEPWPLLGMESGVGLRNPGMSVWVFVLLAKFFGVTTPTSLCLIVILLNILAIAGVIFFAMTYLKDKQKKIWLWSAALISVNPLCLLLHRKIWAQSILPFFCMVMIFCWYKREKKVASFFWGLIGVSLGQIHMSGYFSAFFLFLVTLLIELKSKIFFKRISAWGFWLLGSLIGFLGMIPWIDYMISQQSSVEKTFTLNFKFVAFLRIWTFEAIGTELKYSLGKNFGEFLQNGFAAFSFFGIYITVLAIIGGAFYNRFRNKKAHQKIQYEDFLSFPSGIFICAYLGFAGIFMSVGGFEVYQHYLLAFFPIPVLSFVVFIYTNKEIWAERALKVLWVMQLVLSLSFLNYIHTKPGAPQGGYGIPYQHQKK